jgi:site-specific DNA recombinase
MKALEKIEDGLMQDILSGKYRDYYLIYNRKSTDDAINQKNSIKYQKAVNVRFAFDRKLKIAPLTVQGLCTDGIISERHSGFKQDELMEIIDGKVSFRIERPKFQRLVEYLMKGYFKGVIFLCYDRASRNDSDSLILKRLGKMDCDVYFSLTEYAKSSSGILHQDVDGMFAKFVSEVTSEKVKLSTKNNRDNGVCTYKAPVGYLNNGTMEHKPFDPVRAPIIKDMFELYATGDWSLHSLAKWATQEGLTMPAVKRRRTEDEILAEEEDDIRLEIEAVCRPVEYKQVARILSNRFYTGRIKGNIKGEWVISTSHEALVTDELFEAVQLMLKKKNISQHYKDVLETPYRGLFRCNECGRAYTPYEKKGSIYLGSKCKFDCANNIRSLASKEVEKLAGDLIKNLSFTDEELIEMDARTKTDIAVLELKRNKEMETIERRKKKLREDLLFLRTNKLSLLKTSAYSPEEYLAEENNVQTELNLLMQKEQISEEAMSQVIKEVIKLSELVQNAYLYYQYANSEEKDAIMRTIFSELSYSQKGLKYKCKKGFEALSSRFETKCDPTGNRTRLPSLKSLCPNR